MGKLYLRKAEWKDVDLLFEWANDSEVRSNSFNTDNIEYDDHKYWFEKCMLDKNIDIYVCNLDVDYVGQVRLNYNGESAVISYSIDKKYRGRGLGDRLIKSIESNVKSTHPEISTLIGYVKIDNLASQRIFENNGYAKALNDSKNGHLNYFKKIVQVVE